MFFPNFQKLWSLFDYDEWIEAIAWTIPPSVLCTYVEYFSGKNLNEYFHIFLENEEKLLLDIEFHERMQNCSIVVNLYRMCAENELIPESLLQNYVLHLLSYGAKIYASDLDEFYSLSINKESQFFDVLLSMDLRGNSSRLLKITFMYFRYTLFPNVDDFLKLLLDCYRTTDIKDVRDAIRKISELFAIGSTTRKYYQDNFPNDDEVNSHLELSRCFPSLQQLARYASRVAICDIYNIENVSQFYNVVHNLDLPKFVKSLLTYKKIIYKIY